MDGAADAVDDTPLDESPYEHFFVQDQGKVYVCTKCHLAGELKILKSQACWPIASPNFLAKNWRLPYTCDAPPLELEPETAEQANESLGQGSALGDVEETEGLRGGGDDDLDGEELELLMLQAELEMVEAEAALQALQLEEQEVDDSQLAEAIALSFERVPKTPPKDSKMVDKNDWVEQLVEHGFTREQALWGVQHSEGDIDSAALQATFFAENGSDSDLEPQIEEIPVPPAMPATTQNISAFYAY